MAKLSTPISYHCGSPALTTGLKDAQIKLVQNGVPLFAKGADNAGIVWEAQELARQRPDLPHGLVYRITAFDLLGGSDVPNYGFDPEAHAKAYWNEFEARWPKELDKEMVYAEFPNEVDKNQSKWLGELLYYVGLEAIRRGYKYCGPAWSGGEPEPEHWKHFADYLSLCAQYRGRLAVSVHEYTFSENTVLTDTQPWLIGRVQALNEACKEMGIEPPDVFVTEGGWGANNAPEPHAGVPQLIDMLEMYIKEYPNVRGFALWALDSSGQWKSLSRIINRYIAPLTDAIIAHDWPEKETTQPPPPPPPPDNRVPVRIVKMPAEYTAEEAGDVFSYYWNPYRRSATASADTVMHELDPEYADDTAYAIIVDGWQPSQVEMIRDLEEMGYQYRVEVHKQPPAKPDPRVGLKLGPVLDYQYVKTSDFNDPRDYANKLHEGVDFDIVGGTADNPCDVLCMYDGVVDRVAKTAGYGNQVRIKSYNNGGVFYHRYAHLEDKVPVKVGDTVEEGQAVGRIGNTGNSFGEHVHINLEVPGFGLTGYAVADVVDPWPFCYKDGYSLPPYIPQVKKFDIYSYIFPGSDFGQMIEVKHPSGHTETFQMQRGNRASFGQEFFLVKNSQWEQFWIGTAADDNKEYIWRGLDTSPGPAPQYAERPGSYRFYKQYEYGNIAARWCPRYMAIGEVWNGVGHRVQFYYKDNCSISAANSGPATNRMTLLAHHPSIEFNGIVVNDVIQLTNGNEHWYYAKGIGMVAWRFPQYSAESSVVEILQGRPNLTREKICLST